MYLNPSSSVKIMSHDRRMCRVPICRATVRQIPSINRIRLRHNIISIPKYENSLHTHDHMLKDMAMEHPHASLGHSDPPSPPPRRGERRCFLAVPVQHGCIALDWARGFESLFV
jgi:hypothetical protein